MMGDEQSFSSPLKAQQTSHRSSSYSTRNVYRFETKNLKNIYIDMKNIKHDVAVGSQPQDFCCTSAIFWLTCQPILCLQHGLAAFKRPFGSWRASSSTCLALDKLLAIFCYTMFLLLYAFPLRLHLKRFANW